jgi:hypothetical protein
MGILGRSTTGGVRLSEAYHKFTRPYGPLTLDDVGGISTSPLMPISMAIFQHHSLDRDLLPRAYRYQGRLQVMALGWIQVSRHNSPPV